MCLFCDEYIDPSCAKNFLPSDWPYSDRILSADAYSFTVPGYGPQVFPYALVITKQHHKRFGDVTRLERRSILRSLLFLRNLPSFRRSTKLTIFEHVNCSNPLESCLEHFHLHVLNGDFDFSDDVASLSDPETVHITEGAGLSIDCDYVFTGNISNKPEITGLAARVQAPSQFFRRALAHKLGNSLWDWRLGMNPELMSQLMNEVRTLI